MYAIYKKQCENGTSKFIYLEKTALFGCNVGLIPRILRNSMSSEQAEPYLWHIPIEKALKENGYPNSTIIIDLRPNKNEVDLSLYELLDVWGYSSSGWTPIMLHMRGLFVDEDSTKYNRYDFKIADCEREEPIYEFLYLQGSVSNGELYDKWTAPPVSPTNAALLWPDPLRYFIKCINQRTPMIMKEICA